MNKHIILTIALISLVLGAFTAQAETLSVTSAAGTPGQTVTVNIILDDNDNGVAGTTFTLNYDTANLDLVEVRSDFFPLFSTQNINPSTIEIDGVTYTSALVICPAGSKFAAARVDNGPLGQQTIFELDFVINETTPTGTSLPIQIQQSQVQNSEAGYEELTPIPYLIGIDGTAYPERTLSAPTTAGSIAVEEGSSIVDEDEDGIDDSWEIEHFGNTTTANATSDYDQDGYSDLIEYNNTIAGFLDPASNNFDPTLRNYPGGEGYDQSTNLRIHKDFNGDIKSDILWRGSTGAMYIWFMDGARRTNSLYAFSVRDVNWKVNGTGDFNGDGKADILLRNSESGSLYVYLMDGKTILDGSGSPGSESLRFDIVGIGDFDGNGTDDILWRGNTGAMYMWFMDGATRTRSLYAFTVRDLNWEVEGTGDHNDDGKADILLRNSESGSLYVYLMDGKTILDGSGSPGSESLRFDIVGTGDFDGNGTDDILWRGNTGAMYMWLMNGATRTHSLYAFTVRDLNWEVEGTGDYNGDGKADILLRNSESGSLYIYLMDGKTILNGSGSPGSESLSFDIQ